MAVFVSAYSLQTVARQLDVVALAGEHPQQGGCQAAVIFDDENARAAHLQGYISLS